MQLQGQANEVSLAPRPGVLDAELVEPIDPEEPIELVELMPISPSPLWLEKNGSLQVPVKYPLPTPCHGSAMHLQPSGPVQRLTEAQFCPHVRPLPRWVPGGFEEDAPPAAWVLGLA